MHGADHPHSHKANSEILVLKERWQICVPQQPVNCGGRGGLNSLCYKLESLKTGSIMRSVKRLLVKKSNFSRNLGLQKDAIITTAFCFPMAHELRMVFTFLNDLGINLVPRTYHGGRGIYPFQQTIFRHQQCVKIQLNYDTIYPEIAPYSTG